MSALHENVIVQLIKDYQSFNSPEIERRHGPPSALEFSRIVRSNRPVIFLNTISKWPALEKWKDLGYLRDVLGSHIVTVAETPNGKADAIIDGCFVEPYQTAIPFSEMLDWLSSRPNTPGASCVRYVQSQNDNLSAEFEPLKGDVAELDWATDCFGEEPDASNIWIGNGESTTSLHLDHYENLYCQILGTKTFYLIPPTEYACLNERNFPTAQWNRTDDNEGSFELQVNNSTVPWLTVDPSDIGPTDPNPLKQHCHPIAVTLQPGEVLYLPSLWFHAVYQEADVNGACVAVNHWYDMDYTGPVYSLYNYLRRSTMLWSGRTEEIQLELDNTSGSPV